MFADDQRRGILPFKIAFCFLCVVVPWTASQSLVWGVPADSDPARTIKGQVVDLKGESVRDARIAYSYAYDQERSKYLEISSKSDANGRFALVIPESNPQTTASHSGAVWAYAPTYSLGFASRKKVDGHWTVRIELSPETDTSLIVVDPAGAPVPNAFVGPENYDTDRGFDWVTEGIRRFVGGKTDVNGRINVPALARERLFSVKVSTKEFGDQLQQFVFDKKQPPERTIRLRPVAKLEGRVVADHVLWSRNIKLHFTTRESPRAGEKRPPWPTRGRATVTTDQWGKFVVPIIAEGRLRIVECAVNEELEARLQLPERFIELSAGQTTTLKIPMQRMVRIRGSVVTSDTKRRLSGTKLHISYGKNAQGTDVVTGSDGEFVALVLPGKVSFRCMNLSNTDYIQQGRPPLIDVPDDVEEFEVPAVEVVPSIEVPGCLIDQDDSPVANAEITTYYNNNLCSSAKTDKAGDFVLPRFPKPVDPQKAHYRITLESGESRRMDNDGVILVDAKTLVIQVQPPRKQ